MLPNHQLFSMLFQMGYINSLKQLLAYAKDCNILVPGSQAWKQQISVR